MVDIRAIPKNLLIHTVLLKKIEESDRWGKVQLDNGTELKYARMEPSSKIIRDKNSAEIQLTATLFYDCKNSRPQNVMFRTDDIVVFNDMKHQIKTVEPLFDGKKLHHYEIGLIKYAES